MKFYVMLNGNKSAVFCEKNNKIQHLLKSLCTNNQISMKDFASTYDQIGRKQSIIWSYLREKSLMENFIFSVMSLSIVSIYDMMTF